MSVSIRPVDAADAAGIAGIYNHYVVNTCITFETEPVTTQDMAGRVLQTLNARLPWLVAEVSGQVVGFAYASKWQGRCAYRFSVESTVYLAAGYTGRGVRIATLLRACRFSPGRVHAFNDRRHRLAE